MYGSTRLPRERLIPKLDTIFTTVARGKFGPGASVLIIIMHFFDGTSPERIVTPIRGQRTLVLRLLSWKSEG